VRDDDPRRLLREPEGVPAPAHAVARDRELRARLQSYGRFLDALLVGAVAGGVAVMLWSA
jgi:hypothetical protein